MTEEIQSGGCLCGKISYQFDVPAGSGLGASGSLNVARIAIMKKEDNFSLNEIAEAAYQAEINSKKGPVFTEFANGNAIMN